MLALVGVVLLTYTEIAHATTHTKFSEWYPYYGPVLDLLLEGDCPAQVCNPRINCSADLAAYLAETHRATAVSRCYDGLF